MLKKSLGGLALLTFVFAVASPLLVVLKLAKADSNIRIIRTVIVHYVCPQGGGSIEYSETTEEYEFRTVDHPPYRYVPRGNGTLRKEHIAHDIEDWCVVPVSERIETLDRYAAGYTARCR